MDSVRELRDSNWIDYSG